MKLYNGNKFSFLRSGLILLFILTFFEPYIFIKLKTTGLYGFYLLFQAFKYSLLTIPFWLLVVRFRFSKSVLTLSLFLIFFLISGLIIGLKSPEVKTGNIFLSIKNIYLWVIFMVAIILSKPSINKNTIKTILTFSFLCSFLNIVYSIYVLVIYSGDPSVFYFYKLYQDMGVYKDHNFIRNNHIRSFGLVGSNLTLSQLLLIPASYTASLLIIRKKLIYFLGLSATLFGMYITMTRNPFAVLIISIFVFHLLNKTRKYRYVLIVNFSYLALSFVFLTIAVWYGIVPSWGSAGGRLIQYAKYISLIIDNPLGYGIGSTSVANATYIYRTDLSLMTVFMDMGIVGGSIFFYVMVYIQYKTAMLFFNSANDRESEVYFATFFISSNSLLLLTGFSNIFDISLIPYTILISFTYLYMKAIYNRAFININTTQQ